MKHILTAIALALPCLAVAETSTITTLSPVKPFNYNNPINPLMLCADPTAVVYDGRLYVYGSNDQQEYDAVTPGTSNSYGHIKSLVVMSTADMVNWTHHGVIDMAAVCGNWLWCSWAPSIASRVEADGLTHFYLYFSNSGGGVGVVTSTSPLGPWTAPLNHNLISGSTPGLGECCWPFDPGVVIDENGTGWLTFGGGDPNSTGSKLFPGNARIVKLGDDMASFASDIIPIPAPYQFEASELNIIGGKFVYTYCTSWSDRNDWKQYSTTSAAPSTCSMCYMVSDNPLDPDSWTWGGDYFKNPGSFGYPGGNNHSHLEKFGDDYYFLYHTQVMENLAGITGAYRSIAVNKATVDETNVTISPITATNSGARQLTSRRIQATERQQAETMSNGIGFNVKEFGDPGNCVLQGFKDGAWVELKSVEFGSDPVTEFTAKLRGRGILEIRLDKLDSEPVAIYEWSQSAFKDITFELPTAITGTHNLYFVFANTSGITRFDEWQFGTGSTEGIGSAIIDNGPTTVEYYNLQGQKVENPTKGVFLRKTIRTGQSIVDKVILH